MEACWSASDVMEDEEQMNQTNQIKKHRAQRLHLKFALR